MVNFTTRQGRLYIDGRRVRRAWESMDDWYWFGFQISHVADTQVNGHIHREDDIWDGYIIGDIGEYAYFSEAQLREQRPRIWELRPEDLERVPHRPGIRRVFYGSTVRSSIQ